MGLVRESGDSAESDRHASPSESMERVTPKESLEDICRKVPEPNLSGPSSAAFELAGDTVDGMGVIAFADEFASAHFGLCLLPLFGL